MTNNNITKPPIIITGAIKRLGFELLMHLHQQNEFVIAHYRSANTSETQDNLQKISKLGIKTLQADFSKYNELFQFCQQLQAFNSIKAIIHNASAWQKEPQNAQPIDYIHCFEQMFDVHTKAPYLINLMLTDQLKNYYKLTNKTANLIHISDFKAKNASSDHIAYSSSKAALESLSRSFALRLAPYVRSNSIAPALIEFNQHDSLEYKQKAVNKNLLRRIGGYAEFIKTVDFILNSEFINATCISLDGGRF